MMVLSRGGVEDTMLEAKATKKNPRPRPRTAFPRTDSLEAKDTGASVLQKKKKGFQKIFSGDLQFIGVPRIFDWGRTKLQMT